MRGSSKIWKKTPEILESAKAQADANGACRESVRPRSCVFGFQDFFGPISWDLRPQKKPKQWRVGRDDVYLFFFYLKNVIFKVPVVRICHQQYGLNL